MGFKCCVPNCPFKNTGKPMRSFPRDKELFIRWLNVISREDFLSHEQEKIIKNYRVCDAHFSKECKFVTNHNRTDLKRNAVPTLFLENTAGCRQFQEQSVISGCEILTCAEIEEVSVQPNIFVSRPPSKRTAIHLGSHQQSSPKRSFQLKKTEGISAIPQPSSISRQSLSQLSQYSETCQQSSPQLSSQLFTENVKAIPEPSSVSPRTLRKNLDNNNIKRMSKKIKEKRIKLQKEPQFTRKMNHLAAVENIRTFSEGLHAKDISNREYLGHIVDFAESEKFLKRKLNLTSYRFLKSQITQQCKKPKGRRYTLEDKIFGMSLLKQSPREFKLLRKVFALPSRKTISRVLKGSFFSAGLNTLLLNSLCEEVKKMKPLDKYCILIFDEMSLEPGLTFQKDEDYISGVEEVPHRRNKFADHAMIFMLRGISKKWKQPISYYLVNRSMGAAEMAIEIKKTIAAAQEVGLRVVGTCCDQYNTAVVNRLIAESKETFQRQQREYKSTGFYINEQEIIPIYDVPHLLKGIRNNLLTKIMRFTWKKGQQMASWSDIVKFYELDSGDYDTKMCNKLTDAHIYGDKIKKMKVKNAAQVFSQRVSASMRALLKYSNNVLPPSAEGTADFLLFMDKLFDSLNGSVLKPEPTKPLRCAIQEFSEHIQFYHEALKVLHSIFCVNQRGEKVRLPPSIKNFITTIKGVQQIWKICKQEGFQFLCPRNLNQDPLENTISVIRSHGCRNINPSCVSFRSSFKTLMVNNFFSEHSPHANCEEDDCTLGITSVKRFLNYVRDSSNTNEQYDPENDVFLQDRLKEYKPSQLKSLIIQNQHAYIAGYIAKKIFKKVHTCDYCKGRLLSNAKKTFHQLIHFRSRGSKALLRPNTYFVYLFNYCVDILHFFLPKLYYLKQVKQKLTYVCKKNIINIFSCHQHDLLSLYLDIFIEFYIFTWVKNVNRTLRGLSSSQINDEVKIQARQYFIKHRTKKPAIQNIFKNVQSSSRAAAI